MLKMSSVKLMLGIAVCLLATFCWLLLDKRFGTTAQYPCLRCENPEHWHEGGQVWKGTLSVEVGVAFMENVVAGSLNFFGVIWKANVSELKWQKLLPVLQKQFYKKRQMTVHEIIPELKCQGLLSLEPSALFRCPQNHRHVRFHRQMLHGWTEIYRWNFCFNFLPLVGFLLPSMSMACIGVRFVVA